MVDDNEIIDGGCILLSRQIMTSEIWRKPPEWLKIFLYILLKVNHTDTKLYPRGSNYFNFSEERPEGVSKTQVYEFLRWCKHPRIAILTTQKTTRGVVIKVNNYDKYQTLHNYQNQNKNQNQTNTEPKQNQNETNTINNNGIIKELNNIISLDRQKKEKAKKEKKFIPPTLEEIKKYCIERNNNVDAQKFFDYYNVSNWKDGNGKPIKNWKQKIIAVWEKSSSCKVPPAQKNSEQNAESFYMNLSRG